MTVPVPRLTADPAERADPGAGADDLALVHGWLCRCTASAEEAEELALAVLRRAREGGPACVAAAPRVTRLQYLTAQALLGRRGIL